MPATTSRRANGRSSIKRRSAPRPQPAAAAVDHVTAVYNELRPLIISGQLPPGTRIAERAVVARTGLSRTPVRSALHRLQQEGLIASVGQPGDQRLIVTPLTEIDGREVLLLEGHLEGLAAREAASLPASERRALGRRLRELNREFAAAARSKSSTTLLFDLDLDFHKSFVEAGAGPRLLTLHRALRPQSERYARLYVRVLVDELATSVKEHAAITAAIATGKPAVAQRAAEKNWQSAARRLSNVIAENGERGVWYLRS